jgi:alkyl hydroperoxide reductase subunit AhpC
MIRQEEGFHMATLRVCELTDDGSAGASISLREWLDGRWAILFSHPDDFIHCELELDRWLDIVGNAFRHARIRPLALSRSTCPIDQGWVSQLSGDDCSVSLHERMNGRTLLDFHSYRLRACLEGIDQRFAMIIDPAPRQRRTLIYGAAEKPASPLDLLRLACRIRSAEAHASQCGAERIGSPYVMTQRRSRGSCVVA